MQKSKLQFKIQNECMLGFLNFTLSFCILIFTFSIFPFSVFASTVYIDTDHAEIFEGDTILFHVRVDSENKEINAVEGNILLDYSADLASVVDINTSNSGFYLWPNKPMPFANNAGISFAGGVPNGLDADGAVVFNFVLKLQETGEITLTPDSISVYLNDGKGTKDKVDIKSLTVNVLPSTGTGVVDDLNNLISSDKTPPEPFEIYLGQEGSVFDGKKFLSWSAVDKESGIKYYKVKEGNLPAVRSGNTYVLQEQNKQNKVVVTAYDTAGNARESVYESKAFDLNLVVIVVFVALILIAILMIIRLKLKNQRSK